MGKHLVLELIQRGHDVTLANRGVTRDEFADQVSRVIIDRTDESSIAGKLGHHHFDIIYDCIAYSSNDVKAILNHISCNQYIMISTTAVYDLHMDTREDGFDPHDEAVNWCSRNDYSYQETKRQAERALVQTYADIPSVMVRFPYVIGEDDYTNRFQFYIDHIVNQTPMHADNAENQMAFVRSDEAGKFLAFFADHEFTGAINGASEGTISIHEISNYIQGKTGKGMVLCPGGDAAPYNGGASYSINVERSKEIGFAFSPLHEWVYGLIDHFLDA